MPRKGHTEEPMIRALREAEGGKKVGDLCRELRQLREENRKLKTLVADLTLDKHILQEVLSKKPKACRTSSVGRRDPAGIPAEREACLWADRDHTLDQPLPESARSARRAAHAHTGVSWQQGPVRIPALNGVTATGRMESEYEASLPAVSGRRATSTNEETCQTSRTRTSFFTRGSATESTMEYGLRERPISRQPLVSHSDGS